MPAPMAPPGPYPENSDAKIRQVANILGRDDIIHLLDDVRNKLLGNAVAVQKMAMDFAKNSTLAHAKADDIDAAVQAVSGTWTGRAADQFNTYAGRVGGALVGQQGAVSSVSIALALISQCVIGTYSKAIEFVGTCATSISKIGIKGLIAIATVEIPIVDLFTAKDVLDTVIDAFSTLVGSIADLFQETVKTLGEFQTGSTSLQQIGTNFPDIPELPGNSGMNNEKQWRVNPTAFPE
jgi:uncharacterized protein YukE